MTQQHAPKSEDRKTTLYAIFVIVAGSILVYATGMRGPFLVDDLPCIVNNPTIQSIGLALRTFGQPEAISDGSFTHFNYRPLMPVIYSFVYSMAGLNTWAYHLLNILLHALNGVLVYFLILRLTRHNVASFAAAAWWALHPVHVEAVQNASGTDDLLNATFTIGAILLLLKNRLALSLFVFALALLTKEAAVVGPGSVFLVMYWKIEGSAKEKFRKAILTALPFAVLSISYVAIRYFYQGLGHGNAPVQNLTESLIILPKIFLTYLRIMVLGIGLRINYFIPVVTQVSVSVIIGYLAIAGFWFVAFLSLKKYPLLFLGIVWFFVAFFPVSNLIPIRALVGERFMYMPFVGVALIIAVLIGNLNWKTKRFYLVWALLLVVLAVNSILRIGVWCDEERFWKDILKKEPGFQVYQMYETNLALFYMKNGRFSEAEVLFKEALNQQPDNSKFAANLAQFFYLSGKFEPAMQLFKQLSTQNPNNPAFTNSYELSKAALKKSKPAPD